ncbi:hypothetical protein CDL12_28008 [Handroanthus impetiginosus]|uniref:Ricin B lectin domain-containing protein n=1 Tax=Handroanthus impetiginosus TaxID=429701 RepID=A0A2G9G2H6_9LAMI|nr:hypothetical protein CDL12_28008 [Handroanthus impetiginosus]
MDYPHGHHHHHHHHHDRREEEYPPPGPPYPPPVYDEPPPPFPPPPYVHHTSHVGPGPEAYPPPPPPVFTNYAPPPPVVEAPHHHPHMPHFPQAVHHHTHHPVDEFANKPSVRVYSKAETNYSLTIRDGKVILTRSNPSDPCQHWIKDEKFSTRVKDEEGLPSFALVNKATRQAMKHSIGATHPVQLIPYNPDILDESILWTDKDLGDGYRAIRMVNNIRLNVDAFHGDKNHGGVHDGSKIVLWEWKKGDNQRWKIVPY